MTTELCQYGTCIDRIDITAASVSTMMCAKGRVSDCHEVSVVPLPEEVGPAACSFCSVWLSATAYYDRSSGLCCLAAPQEHLSWADGLEVWPLQSRRNAEVPCLLLLSAKLHHHLCCGFRS